MRPAILVLLRRAEGFEDFLTQLAQAHSRGRASGFWGCPREQAVGIDHGSAPTRSNKQRRAEQTNDKQNAARMAI